MTFTVSGQLRVGTSLKPGVGNSLKVRDTPPTRVQDWRHQVRHRLAHALFERAQNWHTIEEEQCLRSRSLRPEQICIEPKQIITDRDFYFGAADLFLQPPHGVNKTTIEISPPVINNFMLQSRKISGGSGVRLLSMEWRCSFVFFFFCKTGKRRWRWKYASVRVSGSINVSKCRCINIDFIFDANSRYDRSWR